MRFSKLKIIRCCKKVDGFCVLPLSTIGDRELSYLSCGILMRILSLDDGDDFTISGFSKDEGVDIRSLRKVLKELEEKGYYKKGISTNKNGREIGVYHIFSDGAEMYHNKVQICSIKEKPFPHTPYKKKDKEEYISFSKPNIDILDSENDNIDNLNIFFPPFIPQVPAEPSQKEKKERFPIFEKDVFEEFLTNTIYREVVMKNYGVDEKTLDYCINQARKKSSCMIDGVTRREAQFKIKYELDNIPVVKGKLFDRKQAFYNEILNCANQQNLDRDFAMWFYCEWSQLAIPELDIMVFEKKAKDKSWDTFRMLKMSYLSYKRKNEKYY